MTYILSLGLLISSFLKRNYKYIFALFILFMIIMFGWSNNTADWNIYLNKYYNYSSVSKSAEPLFYTLILLFNKIGFDFRIFLIIISVFIVLTYSYIIKTHTENKNFVLALYFIFPFILEV